MDFYFGSGLWIGGEAVWRMEESGEWGWQERVDYRGRYVSFFVFFCRILGIIFGFSWGCFFQRYMDFILGYIVGVFRI